MASVTWGIPTQLSLDQSLLLAWPQVVFLVALTIVCFAGAYVGFLRQEIRTQYSRDALRRTTDLLSPGL